MISQRTARGVARKLILAANLSLFMGHTSVEMNKGYTHLELEPLRAAFITGRRGKNSSWFLRVFAH